MEKEAKQYIDVEIVKEIMKSKNIDEKAMAGSMNVTVQTVKRFLSGADQSHMSGKVFIRVAKALNVPVYVFIHKNYR